MIKNRISQYIEYKGITKYKFYQETGFSNGFLDKEGAIGSDKCEKIISVYSDINLNWLLTGKGSMLRDVETQGRASLPINNATLSKEQEAQSITHATLSKEAQEPIHRIPFFDIEAEGGTRHVVDMSPSTTSHEMIDAGDWFRDASAAMRVHGDSMYPKYPSGSIVVFKEVLDRELIVYGQDYVIETSEYRLIKRVQTSSETHKIKAISYNNDKDIDGNLIHEPLLIPYTKITRLFRILGKVERNESSRIVYNSL